MSVTLRPGELARADHQEQRNGQIRKREDADHPAHGRRWRATLVPDARGHHIDEQPRDHQSRVAHGREDSDANHVCMRSADVVVRL
ncbi:hypothetical protein SDC9_184522 [bioreactor metagenome]|uniref:Uncharacterized protein n=1 Tax=bioreactor metagenome TaxID=1076179 RepID=A0A645HE66_9ZZZZ